VRVLTCPKCGSTAVTATTIRFMGPPHKCICHKCNWQGLQKEARKRGVSDEKSTPLT
jgi:transcription elongation factor Elf1